MARTPALDLYQQKSAPDAATTPMLRAPDLGPGIGASVSRLGASLSEAANTAAEINRIDIQKRQDDARLTVAQMMAQYRADASNLLRTTQENAPNGFQDLTHSYAQALTQQRTQYLQDPRLSTPEARAYFDQATALFTPDALDTAAGAESQGRDQWQADTIKSTIESNANILVGDPSQYSRIRSEFEQTVGGISNPNLRRDALDNGTHAFSAAAVSGMIDRDPAGTLHALQAEHPEGLVAELSASARATAINQAQAEIDRRNARWRSQVEQSVSSAERLMQLGINVPSAPSVDSVRAALGPERALAYEAARAQSTQFGRLSTMSTPELMSVANDQSPAGNEHDAIIREAERRGAAQIIQERATDPMQAQVRQGLVPEADVVGAARTGDWNMLSGILANRAASAQEFARNRGAAPLPLTQFEARAIAPVIQQMPWQQRNAILHNFSAWMGGDTPAYRALMGQLFPHSPTSAYAGYIAGLGPQNAQDAQILLRGEDLLASRDTTPAEGQGATGRRQTPLVNLPQEDALRRAFTSRVGTAYAGLPGSSGMEQAQEDTYQSFRAAYAALSEQSRDFTPASSSINSGRADSAVRIATGGLTNWNGRQTIMPPGMSRDQFTGNVRTAFNQWDYVLRDQNPEHYQLIPLGTSDRGYRYIVSADGRTPVLSPGGRPVQIEVRRSSVPLAPAPGGGQ